MADDSIMDSSSVETLKKANKLITKHEALSSENQSAASAGNTVHKSMQKKSRKRNNKRRVRPKIETTCVDTEPVKFPCTLCGKQYSHQRSLNEHMRTHTMGNSFSCTFCGKKFAQKKILTEHLRTHTKERPFQCQYCERKFPTRSTQRKHEATHIAEKRHKCEQCGMLFSGQGSLFYHLKVHSGERPFKCDQCEKTFITKSHLRRHIRAHTGEKPFVCPYCGLKVVRNGTLQNHIRKHTGENLYTCQHCDKKFYNERSFDYHLKRHAGVKPYACEYCDFCFTNAHHLRRHMARVHKDIVAKEVQKKLQDDADRQSQHAVNGDAGYANTDIEPLAQVLDIKPPTPVVDLKIPHTAVRRRCSFFCTYCPKEFLHKRSLEYHLKFHETMLRCDRDPNNLSDHSILPDVPEPDIALDHLDLGAALLCEIGMDSQSKTIDESDDDNTIQNEFVNAQDSD